MKLPAGWSWVFILSSFIMVHSHAHIRAPAVIGGQDIITDQIVQAQLNDSAFKGTVIVFLSVTCPVTESHFAEIRQLAEEFHQYRFIGVHSNLDESIEKARVYFKKAALSFAFIRDRDQYIANEFKALKTPHAFLVDVKGNILYQGGISDSEKMGRAEVFYLRDALKDHSQGRAIKAPYGRTLGCVIKRGDEHVW